MEEEPTLEVRIEEAGSSTEDIDMLRRQQEKALEEFEETHRKYGPGSKDVAHLVSNATEEILAILKKQERVSGFRKRVYDFFRDHGIINLYERRVRKHFDRAESYIGELGKVIEEKEEGLDCSEEGREGPRYIVDSRKRLARSAANAIVANENVIEAYSNELLKKREELEELSREEAKKGTEKPEERSFLERQAEKLSGEIESAKDSVRELDIDLRVYDAEIESNQGIRDTAEQYISVGNDVYYGLRSTMAVLKAYVSGTRSMGRGLNEMSKVLHQGTALWARLNKAAECAGNALVESLDTLDGKLEKIDTDFQLPEHFGEMRRRNNEDKVDSSLSREMRVKKYATVFYN